jgi:hypothetical protein
MITITCCIKSGPTSDMITYPNVKEDELLRGVSINMRI